MVSDTTVNASFNNERANSELRKQGDGKLDDEVRREAEQRRDEMNMMEKAGDWLAGAWLSMNNTIGQWGRDVADMVSEFGERAMNWAGGEGFRTDGEIEATKWALITAGLDSNSIHLASNDGGWNVYYEDRSRVGSLNIQGDNNIGYDTAVKAALDEYERISDAYNSAYNAANNEYNKMFSEALSAYDGYVPVEPTAEDLRNAKETLNSSYTMPREKGSNFFTDSSLYQTAKNEYNNALQNYTDTEYKFDEDNRDKSKESYEELSAITDNGKTPEDNAKEALERFGMQYLKEWTADAFLNRQGENILDRFVGFVSAWIGAEYVAQKYLVPGNPLNLSIPFSQSYYYDMSDRSSVGVNSTVKFNFDYNPRGGVNLGIPEYNINLEGRYRFNWNNGK